jgi:hypothetical protein
VADSKDALVTRIHRERYASWIIHNSTTQSIMLLRAAAFIALQIELGCKPTGERCKAGTKEWRECSCGLKYDHALSQARSLMVQWETEDIEQERIRLEEEAISDTWTE